jgi:hypothetical protein
MSNDNTQDAAEPSPASAGSQPVAWAVGNPALVSSRTRAVSVHPQRKWAEASARHNGRSEDDILPLYTHPVPPDRPVGLGFDDMRLTDDERALVRRLAEEREDGHPRAWTNRALTSNDRATLRVMLERIG